MNTWTKIWVWVVWALDWRNQSTLRLNVFNIYIYIEVDYDIL